MSHNVTFYQAIKVSMGCIFYLVLLVALVIFSGLANLAAIWPHFLSPFLASHSARSPLWEWLSWGER